MVSNRSAACAQTSGDFSERHRDEIAFGKPRMRQSEAGLRSGYVAKSDEVDVDETRAPAYLGCPVATERSLDEVAGDEQGVRIEFGAEHQRDIQTGQNHREPERAEGEACENVGGPVHTKVDARKPQSGHSEQGDA